MKLPKLDERTLKMMENYVKLREEGRSVSEIAELYGLSRPTVYSHLDEIAENAGVTRDSLLERPFVADHSGRNFAHLKPIDITELEKKFSDIEKGIREAKEELASIIAEQEEDLRILEMEMED